MSRGFLSGIVWGGVVAALGLAVASQIAPPAGPGDLPSATPASASAPAAVPAEEPIGPSLDIRRPGSVARSAEEAPAEAPAASGPVVDLAPPPGSEFARPRPEEEAILPGAETGPETGPAPEALPDIAAPRTRPDAESAPRPAPQLAAPGAIGAPVAESAPPPPVPQTEAPQPGRAEPAALDAPRDEEPPQAPAPAPAPAPGFAPAIDGVRTDRLPRIGDAPPAAVPVAEDAIPAEEDEDAPPVRRYARPFENPQGRPVFAILLLDDGAPDLDREALAALPFPVSFVIDPLRPDAAALAEPYRAAGQEVLMLATGIPPGATAADLETTFQSHATALPEAVALLDLAEGGFQDDRMLATQVATLVAAQGRGMLTRDRGLNAADQAARRVGLPAAVVFRSIDGEGEDAAAIRRHLDRAAFRAAQEGRVAVIGMARPETVAALQQWSAESRAATVALAPATAVMTGG